MVCKGEQKSSKKSSIDTGGVGEVKGGSNRGRLTQVEEEADLRFSRCGIWVEKNNNGQNFF
jgi:hypothetical protein